MHADVAAGFSTAPFNAPVIASERLEGCLLCGARDSSVVATGYDYEMETCSNEWQFRCCSDCGHVQLNPRPAVSELAAIYPSTYYSYAPGGGVGPIARKGKEWLDDRKFREICRFLPQRPSSFLDIGCGDGRYLRLMARRGMQRNRIHGIELDADRVNRLASEGFVVENARLEEARSVPEGGVELATMFHVIEHLADPRSAVRKVASLVSKGGVFAVETPNVDSLDARLFRKTYWGGYHIPRHWHLFRESTLRRVLESEGFRVEAVRYKTGHSFWLYSFHHALRYNRRFPMPRLAKLFDPLSSLVPLIAVTGFDTLRAAFGARTSAIMMIARRV